MYKIELNLVKHRFARFECKNYKLVDGVFFFSGVNGDVNKTKAIPSMHIEDMIIEEI